MKKIIMSGLVLLVGGISYASDAAHGGDHAIPVQAILTQLFNFSILIGLLIYLLRKPLKSFFSSRGEAFHEHLRKAEFAQKEAETKKHAIKDRLEALHATAGENIEKAKAEAEELKHKIIDDAKTLAGKLKLEADRTAMYELEKAKAIVRQELIATSMASAKDILIEKIDAKEHGRLQGEFVDKIQAVQ